MFGRRKSQPALPTAPTGTEPPASLAAAGPRLRIRLYGADQAGVDRLESQAAGIGADEIGLELRQISPELSAGLAIDTPQGYVKVSSAMLRGWGCTLDEAFGVALAAARSAEFAPTRLGDAAVLIQDDVHAGVGWLAPQALSTLPISGTPLAWALARDLTLVTSAEEPNAGALAAAMARDLIQGVQRVESVTPHLLTDHGWEPTTWPATPEHGDALAERLHRSQVYGRQAEPLRALLAAAGRDVFVAEYAVYGRPDGGPMALATWTEGVLTALPETDAIALVRTDGQTATLPREALFAQAQSLLEPLTDTPARYLTTGFPTDEMVLPLLTG